MEINTLEFFNKNRVSVPLGLNDVFVLKIWISIIRYGDLDCIHRGKNMSRPYLLNYKSLNPTPDF